MSVQHTEHETLSEGLLICGIVPSVRECYVVDDTNIVPLCNSILNIFDMVNITGRPSNNNNDNNNNNNNNNNNKHKEWSVTRNFSVYNASSIMLGTSGELDT